MNHSTENPAESEGKVNVLPDTPPRIGLVVEFIPPVIVGGQPQIKVSMHGLAGFIDVHNLAAHAILWAVQQEAGMKQMEQLAKRGDFLKQ